jgi:tetratricopeptide (TPR) repeat protein
VGDDVLARLERHRDVLAKLQLQPVLTGSSIVDGRAYQQIASFLQHRLGRAADAVPVYEQAVRLDPRNTYARHGLGIALRNAKRPEEALAVLDALLRDTRPTAAVFYTRHYANCDLSRYADAAADLEQVVALDPKHADGWNGLAIERKRAGDFDGSLAAFDTALGLQPTHEYAQRNRAALFLEYGQYAEGLPVVEQLLAAQPANDWLAFLRGVAYLGLDRGPEAAAALSQVLATANDRYHETSRILRAIAQLGVDAAAARADLDTVLRRTNCPGKVGLCWLVAGLREPFPWPRALPAAAVEPPALSEAVAAYARTVRPADAPALHAAEPWDHVEAAEHGIAGALQSGDRTLALARMRALHAFLGASPKPIVLSWSHGLAQVFRAIGAPLDAAARSLLATVAGATRGRVPRDALLAAAL